MPFFPRILKHFVGFGHLVRHTALVQRLASEFLQAMPQRQKFRAIAAQLACQLRCRRPLNDAAQNQAHGRRRSTHAMPCRPGEKIEDPSAMCALIIHHRLSVPAMDAQTFAGLTSGAGQTFRVKQLEQFVITGLLVHEIEKGKVHDLPP
jgi:hypothetical protein